MKGSQFKKLPLVFKMVTTWKYEYGRNDLADQWSQGRGVDMEDKWVIDRDCLKNLKFKRNSGKLY